MGRRARRPRVAGHRRRRRSPRGSPVRGRHERQRELPAAVGRVDVGEQARRAHHRHPDAALPRRRRAPERPDAGRLQAIQAWVAGIPGLKLSDPTRTVGEFLQAPPTAAIPSQDKQAALVPVAFLADKAEVTIGGDTALYAVAQALRASAASTLGASGLTVHVTGAGGFFADFITAFSGIDGILLLVALGVVFLILLIVYRSPILPFAVLITAMFGLSLAALVVFPLAKNGVISLSGQSQGILSILVVGAATDYALLLVARFKEELHDEESTWAAMKTAWRAAVEPIAASAATVVLGLLCLRLSDLGSTKGLGPVGALGIVGAFVASLTFLPAVLLLIGRRIFWPQVPRVDHVHSADAVGTRGHLGSGGRHGRAPPAAHLGRHAAGARDLRGLPAHAQRPGHRPVGPLPHEGRLGHGTGGAGPPLPRRLRLPGPDRRARGQGRCRRAGARLDGRREQRAGRSRARTAPQGRRRSGHRAGDARRGCRQRGGRGHHRDASRLSRPGRQRRARRRAPRPRTSTCGSRASATSRSSSRRSSP